MVRILSTFDPNRELQPDDLNKERAFLGNEICERLNINANDPDTILLNLNLFHLIVLCIATRESGELMDSASTLHVTVYPKKVSVVDAMFSKDGRYVIGCVGSSAHVWNPTDGQLLGNVLLNTYPGFPISSIRNLIATGSTIHSSLHVWNLDCIYESRTSSSIRVYKGPVDQLACVPQERIVFIKNCFPLNSHKGLKYINTFGIDVWNVATGTYRELLPFDKYGKLNQMEVSADGRQMALLLNPIHDSYVAVFNFSKADPADSGATNIQTHVAFA